jgi:bifunctional UDP-N-acetylglucosamine pyrophosphorylase/glucosamine-1-phosphate N-acetyltransferase
MVNHNRKKQNSKALKLAEQGLEIIDHKRIDIRGDIKFGENVTVDIDVIFKGSVEIGNNVKIGPYCIIKDSKIEDNVEIKENSSLSFVEVGEKSRIGPYARIRSNTKVGKGTHIGNFVEIKNSTIGEMCQINHHSFIGDALIGDNVIIAAGSITCNYNGRRVEVTKIENRAFIGSGVELIAPVTIGEGAFVAAGSTIAENVPDNVTAFCRKKEITFKKNKKK